MDLMFGGLTDLRTHEIVYENVMPAANPDTLEELRKLSSTRKSIEEWLSSPGGLQRYEQGIQKLEIYLPLLENLLLNYWPSFMSSWVQKLSIRWRSVLKASSVFGRSTKHIHVDLNSELAMILFLYGAMLRERALEVSLSDMHDRLPQSQMLLRKASGVYDYLATVADTYLHTLPTSRPPEASVHVSSLMSLICLAETQAVIARSAEESGKSAGLIAKLHFGVAEISEECIGKCREIDIVFKDISPRLQDFVKSLKALHELRGYKYLASSQEDDGGTGAKIGLLQKALANSKTYVPRDKSWKSVLKRVIDEVTTLMNKHVHENNVVWLEKVPGLDELPSPEGRKVATVIPYQPLETKRTLSFILP